jgi:hypothetical protein
MMERYIEVGALLRGQVRRELAKNGIPYTEHKGLLESVFTFENATDEQWRGVHKWLSDHQNQGT